MTKIIGYEHRRSVSVICRLEFVAALSGTLLGFEGALHGA